MKSLAKRIMEYAEAAPEATPICPSALLHLGKRGVVNQALSRLARSGQLPRICQGVYVRPIETRFGRCAPSIDKSLRSRAAQDALAADYANMLAIGMLLREDEPFGTLMQRCALLEERANAAQAV